MYGVSTAVCLTVLTVVPIVLQTTAAAATREKRDALSAIQGVLRVLAPAIAPLIPTETTEQNSWSLNNRIPMTAEADRGVSRIGRMDINDLFSTGRGKNKYYKKYKKYMLPLLLAYKLKFFTLIPVLIGGLVLLTGATGLAGFFFALFAATMGLKGGGDH